MRISFFIILLIFPILLFSQTTISGIINDYFKVTEVIPAKACVRVDNTAGLNRNDMVMIIQMKGASVVTTNGATFGSVTSMNNAGNYEIGFVCWVADDSVYLYKQFLQSYTVADKVQLVRIPQYNSAIVTGSLEAMPWDSAAGKGGVLALTVYDDLFLNAPISANNTGYKGGAFMLSNGTCANIGAPSGYFYNATSLSPQNGAYKGESVSTLPISYSGGKGANANGGGGGNNHNNGGGGGGNLSAGGAGGGNSSATGCSVSNPARPAYGLTNSSGAKIFMGGGGGAGHANGPAGSGGSGGGIIFIHANTIYNNGYRISSSGEKGGSTIGNGASGGGAGGTIILDINNYADNVDLQADGGVGGNEDDDLTSQRCYGEGGGGGGGAIFFKTTMPAGVVSVAGGLKGNRLRSLNCGTIVPATDGAAGNIFSSYAYMQSSTLSAVCAAHPLHVQVIYFKAIASNDAARLEWEMPGRNDVNLFILERKTDGPDWRSIYEVAGSGAVAKYEWLDKNLLKGFYQYRLKILERSGAVKYSPIQTIEINKTKQVFVFPNPASSGITIIYPFKPNSQLQIFDALGQLVFQKKILSETQIFKQNISFLKKGIYRIVADQQSSMLIVQ